jgi:hypothetical protein
VDGHDVVDAAVDGVDDLGVEFGEGSSSVHPVAVGNGQDPCHRVSLAQHPEAHVQQLDAGWMADNADNTDNTDNTDNADLVTDCREAAAGWTW